MRYEKDGKHIEYGTLLRNGYTDWGFTEEKPLLGLYGRQKDSKITQLGVITLEPACFIEEVVEVIEVEEPSWWEENITNSTIVTRIREGSLLLKIVLIGAVVIILMTITLCCLIRYMKKKVDQK